MKMKEQNMKMKEQNMQMKEQKKHLWFFFAICD